MINNNLPRKIMQPFQRGSDFASLIFISSNILSLKLHEYMEREIKENERCGNTSYLLGGISYVSDFYVI